MGSKETETETTDTQGEVGDPTLQVRRPRVQRLSEKPSCGQGEGGSVWHQTPTEETAWVQGPSRMLTKSPARGGGTRGRWVPSC